MRKVSFREKLRYAFDNFMGKGTVALIGMLFLITMVVVVITGVVSCVVRPDSGAGNMIWVSLMHALDAGTLAGDDTSGLGYLALMTVVTVCGIFVTSILIGIISTGFEEKLNSLRKGFSRVIESRHTVIIGFNDSIYTIISELAEANANQKRACILVVGEEEKEVMEEKIRSHIQDFKTTRVICRSGRATESSLLEMSSVETARSIIVNEEDDYKVIRTLLALVAYLKQKDAFDNSAYITTIIHDMENLEAARIAGEGKAEVIFFKNMIARVIANTCRQPGLSTVLTEMFGFDGDEFYFEEFPVLTGKKFGDVLGMFQKSVVVGLLKEGRPLLNPDMDTVIEEGDQIIHLAADDGVSVPQEIKTPVDISRLLIKERMTEEQKDSYDLLILGQNDVLPLILEELNDFLDQESCITIACDVLPEGAEELWGNKKYRVQILETPIYEKRVLEELLQKDTENLLLLSDSNCEKEDADARILLLLLQIRAISAKNGWEFAITSEMNSVENQKLMQVANVNDFVVGSSITNLIIAQVSENRHLAEFFEIMLTSEGSELYMKRASSYFVTGVEVSFYEVTEAVKQKSEIAMGYKKKVNGEWKIVVNPDKAKKILFHEDDYLIVVAEE